MTEPTASPQHQQQQPVPEKELPFEEPTLWKDEENNGKLPQQEGELPITSTGGQNQPPSGEKEGEGNNGNIKEEEGERKQPPGIVSTKQLELFNHLVQPIWIFDFVQGRNRWTNQAGLELWNAPNLEDYQNRDMVSKRSESTKKKLQQIQAIIEDGGSTSEYWTIYPKGVAKTLHITLTGIRLDVADGHYCMLMHGVPQDTEKIETESLRGVEILRHIPMSVCQFSMSGEVMFQNQWAQFPTSSSSSHRTTVMSDSSKQNNRNLDDSKTDESQEEKTESSSNNNKTNATTEKNVAATEKQSTNHSDTATRNDFMKRFINQKVAQEAFTTIQTSSEQFIQLEAELRSTKHAGKSEWSEVQLRKTTDPVTGKQVILYSAQDKSDARKAQKAQEASLHKSHFLAIMAHEIRTPLHQVIGFIDLLDQTQPLTREQKGFVKLLQSSAAGLMTVINDVLDYSKLEAGQMKIEAIPYEPLSVVQGTIAAVRTSYQEKDLSLAVNWSKDIPFRLIGDPNRLRQILLNLLSNAKKFTKQGGIHVHACTMNKDDPFVRKHSVSQKARSTHAENNCSRGRRRDSDRSNATKDIAPESWLKVTVSDTGIGVCEENQHLIFQKYEQGNLSVARNFGGTGLGLSICQLLVQSMGGAIGVESQLGQGSHFWFLLPVRVPSKNTTTDEAETELHQAGEKEEVCLNILVAEDNRINQKLISNMLKRLGHRSTIAENGKIAIEKVEEDGSFFDLILMDIQMPVYVTGSCDLCRSCCSAIIISHASFFKYFH